MIVVADASVLVAELLRHRGRALVTRDDLRVIVAEEQWNETEYELKRRIGIIADQGRLTAERKNSTNQCANWWTAERSTSFLALCTPTRKLSLAGAFPAIQTTGRRWLLRSRSVSESLPRTTTS